MKTQKNRIKYQSQLQRRKAKWGYVFLIPWLLVFAVFYAYPLAYGIIISFTDSKLGSTTYIGLRNYGKILRDYAFWRSVVRCFERMDVQSSQHRRTAPVILD